MKCKLVVVLFMMLSAVSGMSYAADEQASLGSQAGEAAQALKGTAEETLSTGAMKVADSSRKVEAEAQDTLKTLQQQWDVLAQQLQEKTQQIQKQVQQQVEDFKKSFNSPKK